MAAKLLQPVIESASIPLAAAGTAFIANSASHGVLKAMQDIIWNPTS